MTANCSLSGSEYFSMWEQFSFWCCVCSISNPQKSFVLIAHWYLRHRLCDVMSISRKWRDRSHCALVCVCVFVLWCVFVSAFVVVAAVVPGIVCAIGLCVIYASLFIDAPTGVSLFPKKPAKCSRRALRTAKTDQNRSGPTRTRTRLKQKEASVVRPCHELGHGPPYSPNRKPINLQCRSI